ncbi:MAG: CHAT domain-containing protein, partial [Bacteroidota bacterium]
MRKVWILFCIQLTALGLWAQGPSQPKDPVSPAQQLFQQAEALYAQQPDSAIQYYQAVLPEASQEQNWELYVKSCCILYNILFKRQAYDLMGQYAQDAFNIAFRQLSPEATIFIAATNNLGTYHYIKGDYEEAASIMRQTIKLLEAQEDPHPVHLAKCYSNLGRYHQKRGDFNESLLYYQTAARIKECSEATYNQYSQAISQHLIARTFLVLEQADSAIAYSHRAEVLLRSSQHAQYQRKRLDVLLSLGEAFLQIGQLDSTRWYLRQYQREEEQASALQNSRYLVLQADLNLRRQQPQLALQYLRKARSIRSQKYGAKHIDLAKLDREIGASHLAQNQPDSAITVYQRGLSLLKRDSLMELGMYRNPLQAYSLLLALGEAYEHKRQPDQALTQYQQAAELVSQIRTSLYSLEAKQFWTSKKFAQVYVHIVRLSEELLRRTSDSHYFELAFQAAEAHKAFSLYEDQQHQLARNHTQLPDSVWAEGQAIEREIQFYQQKLLKIEAKGTSNPLLEEYQNKIFAYQKLRDQWRADLQTDFPAFYRQMHAPLQLLSLDSVRLQLPEKGLLVEYFRADSHYYALGLTQNDFYLQKIERSSIESELTKIARFLYSPAGTSEDLPDFVQSATNLYAQLLPHDLMGTSFGELLIIPDGQLAYLPFELLIQDQASTETPPTQWRELRYLLRDHPIQYAYSASLLWGKRADKTAVFREPWLGIAPTYEGAYYLANNKEEVQQIREVVGGRCMIEQAANKANFVAQAGGSQMLHLALHGLADLEDPMQAHLAFSTEEQNPNARLYAWEIPYLPLRSDLVVLSACETGYGQFQDGQGVMSLARAFSLAGCKSVINSLWPLDDEAGQIINQNLYRRLLEGENKAEALR